MGGNSDGVDCGGCSAAVAPIDDACSCNGDGSVGCSNNAECAGFGGTCECFLHPPLHFNPGGTPICVTDRISGAMGGSVDTVSGTASLTAPTRETIYIGFGQQQACPICDAGLCNGGPRDGLACSVDGSDATFGDVSYDCPPNPLSNITGTGFGQPINLTTGSFSLPFNLACDAPLGGYDCACSTCTLNNQIACNSDAECAAVFAGTCRTDSLHGGVSRAPNGCGDLVCSPDPSLQPQYGRVPHNHEVK